MKILVLILMLPFLACQKAAKKTDAPIVDAPSTGAAATPIAPVGPPVKMKLAQTAMVATPLTSTGDNSDARFSPDGARVLFVSRSRPTHKQAQVYELHIGLMKEKRVTFHDGDDAGPLYMPDGARLLFSSSTDEIKEDPYVSTRLMKNFAPDAYAKRMKSLGLDTLPDEGSELYAETLNGRVIERLTHSPGFDGDADVDPKGKMIVFSSARDGRGTVHLYRMVGRAQVRLTDGPVVDRGARFSPDGRSLIWSRRALDVKTDRVQLMIAEGPSFTKVRPLTDGSFLDLGATFSPTTDDIVFASNRDGKFFNLYVTDRAGRCVRRLTEAELDQLQPAFSPDGKRLLFTAHLHAANSPAAPQQNIYVMDYRSPAPCTAPAPTPAATPVPPAATPTPAPAATPKPSPTPAPTPSATPAPSPSPTASPKP